MLKLAIFIGVRRAVGASRSEHGHSIRSINRSKTREKHGQEVKDRPGEQVAERPGRAAAHKAREMS